jgi:hypothetical protein
MHHLLFNFKYLYIIFIFLLGFSACKDIPRDNILDPKNPSSYRDWIISIEAFVNTENDKSYNEYLISALNTIYNRYPEKLTIVHYHRNVGTFIDSLSITENEFIYEDYINRFDSQKGVPDVFINGTLVRIKGTSSIESAIERFERALVPLMKENSHFTIEPDLSQEGNILKLNLKLARLGSELAKNIIIRVVLVEEINPELQSHVVRDVNTSNIIPELEPGDIKEIKFEGIRIDPQSTQSLVITVLSNDDLVVRQSLEVLIP